MCPLEQILHEYVNACIKNGEAQDKGDSKTANKQYRIITNIEKDLKSIPEYGIDKLLLYLEHPNDYVKFHTSSIVLPIASQEAQDVLLELSKKRGTVAFIAEVMLSEWKKGNLKFN